VIGPTSAPGSIAAEKLRDSPKSSVQALQSALRLSELRDCTSATQALRFKKVDRPSVESQSTTSTMARKQWRRVFDGYPHATVNSTMVAPLLSPAENRQLFDSFS